MISAQSDKGKLTVKKLISILKKEYKVPVKVLAGKEGLENEITTFEINRPGITLAGYFKDFAYNRIQVIGRGENSYITSLPPHKRKEILDKFFSFPMPCCFFTYGNKPPKYMILLAEKVKVPLLITTIPTGETVETLTEVLENVLAPTITLHGVLVEVYGLGVLILGKSGVGKSECALELVTRGHRLVADDVIVVKRTAPGVLMGTGEEIVKYCLEIRGLGIINIKDLYGIGAVRDKKRIELVVRLEEWNPRKQYERLGLTSKSESILGVELPLLEIPVRPGRNIPIIIEAAARNERLIRSGYITPQIIDKKFQKKVEQERKEREKNESKRNNH